MTKDIVCRSLIIDAPHTYYSLILAAPTNRIKDQPFTISLQRSQANIYQTIIIKIKRHPFLLICKHKNHPIMGLQTTKLQTEDTIYFTN